MGTFFSSEHSKMRVIEVAETSSNLLDHASVMIGIADEHLINSPELTPNQVWSHTK